MSTAQGSAVSGGQRALAWLSIGCALVLTVVLVIFSVRNLAALVTMVVGVAVGAAGGWWLITEHPPRRWVGLGGAVVGLAIIVAAVLAAADGDRPLVRAALVLVLFVVTIGSARLAMVRHLHAQDALQPHAVTRPRHPVLICNPWSGGGKVEQFGLVELANELGVETVMLDHGLDLEQLARDAIARGADCIGMAGGDGSQALVASIAVECGIPFVCVTAGTRNHFAQDLGLDRNDPRTSVHAFRDAVERRIDYATVNDRFFVNNVSLGVYAAIVQQDGYRDAKVETTETMLPDLLGNTNAPFDLQFATRTAPRSTARSSSRSRTTRMWSAPPSTPDNDASSTPASSVSSPSPEPPGKTPQHSSPSTPSDDETAVGTGTSSPPRASRFARDRVRPSLASTGRHSRWRPR